VVFWVSGIQGLHGAQRLVICTIGAENNLLMFHGAAIENQRQFIERLNDSRSSIIIFDRICL